MAYIEEGRAEKVATNAETRVEIATTKIPAGRGREQDTEDAAWRDKASNIEPMKGDREAAGSNPKTTRRRKL